jgi:putative ABC transport system ATP-binding protein
MAEVAELRGIGRTYGSDPPVVALRDIDLTIHRGDWLAIVGPSGSGKSTLLNILGCLDRPTAGTYLVDGIDAAALSDAERTALRGRTIGFVFQAFHLLGHRTVLENVMLGELYAGGERAGRAERARRALDRVGMGERRSFLPTRLSGGEQQRVAIARALAQEPKLLLFDEPTSALDPELVGEVLKVIHELADEGRSMVLVTHEIRFARDVADWVLFMGDGDIVEEGPPDAVIGRPRHDRTRAFLRQILEH